MQCARCGTFIADTATHCMVCGTVVATQAVDSYGATTFAPAIGATQPVASQPMATMRSNAPPAQQQPQPTGPTKYIIMQSSEPPPSPYHATMQSVTAPPPAAAPYAPPPSPYGVNPMGAPPPMYPMMYPQQQQVAVRGTPGLAVASLVCGLLGWIPLWIGFILCVLAIIFGAIAISQTRPGQPGRGLAITGLVFGLVLLLPAACGL